MKKSILFGLMLVGIAVLMAGCAAGHNPSVHTANEVGNVAGFWRGLWHGMICPITFIISLFSDNVSIYEIHNNGGWYNFGFLLGAGSALGGSGASASRSRS
ncbi:hypothetical protein KGQ27_01590 [Patescibacteria group bacterium]|nr:hypothetical protein [Patescibacteria group bacterium]MDE1946467.1 hypothetical protein [Patescibacteria group bacterium]MDE2011181.1 hypothetical protein [Patescibacteria group bacterium]MDE2233577.1 hypothetical protein [Patescibacteria group bacterium]